MINCISEPVSYKLHNDLIFTQNRTKIKRTISKKENKI